MATATTDMDSTTTTAFLAAVPALPVADERRAVAFFERGDLGRPVRRGRPTEARAIDWEEGIPEASAAPWRISPDEVRRDLRRDARRGAAAPVLRARARGGGDRGRHVRGPRRRGAALSFFAEAGMEAMAPSSMAGYCDGRYTSECRVDDVDREHERLLALDAAVVKLPTTQPWGRRSVWFRDPDGNLVNLFADVAPRADGARSSADLAAPAATGDEEGSAMAEWADAVVREYFERLLNAQDPFVCDELLAPDYLDHDAPPGTPPGPGSKGVRGCLPRRLPGPAGLHRGRGGRGRQGVRARPVARHPQGLGRPVPAVRDRPAARRRPDAPGRAVVGLLVPSGVWASDHFGVVADLVLP